MLVVTVSVEGAVSFWDDVAPPAGGGRDGDCSIAASTTLLVFPGVLILCW
jgi:hypothetical protein